MPPTNIWLDGVIEGDVVLTLTFTGDGMPTLEDHVRLTVMEPASYSPGGNGTVCIWAPLHTYSNSNDVNNVGYSDGIALANAIMQQGFTNVVWYRDETGDADLELGSCTTANYLAMRNAGVICVTASHGEPGYHHAVFAPYTTEGRTVISNWCASYVGMSCELWIPSVPDPSNPGYYYARVPSSWHQSNWKPSLDSNRAITVWSVCHSATAAYLTSSLKEAGGGRWRIGYVGVTIGMINSDVNRTFFNYMNGTTGDERRRTAGAAYNNGAEYHSSVRMSGNPWTTLCPAPVMRNWILPVNNFPEPGTGASPGLAWGCLTFDTYLDYTLPASQVVTGNDVTGVRWVRLGVGKRAIGFFYDRTFKDEIEFKLHGPLCESEGVGGGRCVDLNRKMPNGETWSLAIY
jgi:hypothetical protein